MASLLFEEIAVNREPGLFPFPLQLPSLLLSHLDVTTEPRNSGSDRDCSCLNWGMLV